MLKTGNSMIDNHIEEMKDCTCKLCGLMSKNQQLKELPIAWGDNINEDGYLKLKLCDKCRSKLIKEYSNAVIKCAKELHERK